MDGSDSAAEEDPISNGPVFSGYIMMDRISGNPESERRFTIDTDSIMEPMSITRESDTERERDSHDYANGSRIDSDGETISGSLEYDPTGESDFKDWYKLSLPDVDPSPGSPSGPHNVSIQLTSYLDGGGSHDDLYEYNLVPASGGYDLESDYYDYVWIHVKYYDPWMGELDIGGTKFYYDDMDSSDGWDHADNWTFHFSTPVPSTGPEDANGFQDGLTEVGWYYISFGMNWREKVDAPERDGFSVNYEFDVETDVRENTDDGANVIDEAGEFSGKDARRVQSAFDQVDWYRFTGSDPNKLWNMTFVINRTYGAAGINNNTQMIFDTYQYFFISTPTPGNDEIWDTGDDGWSSLWWVYTYYISTTGSIPSGQSVSFQINNTWTDHPDRGVYIGTYVEPVTAGYEGTQITGFYYPDWTTFSDYTIDIEIVEEEVNRRPHLSDPEISSDNRFSRSGGDMSNTFTFEVVYTDPDGDEPENLDLYLDQGTPKEMKFSMLEEHDDADIDSGRKYRLELEGEEIGEKDGAFSVMINASDKTGKGSIRKSLRTENLYLNDTLFIWDDDPVEHVPGGPLDPVSEDQGVVMIPLEYLNGGMFKDPENSFTDFKVFNQTSGDWSDNSKQDILRMEIVYREGDGWYAELRTLPDKHGDELIRIRAADAHSHVEANLSISVLSVNDPPVLDSVEFNGEEVPVDRSRPDELEVDLRDFSIKEEEPFEIILHASDSDPEEDRTPIIYSLVGVGKGSFSSTPEIDPSSGVMRFNPENSDVRTNGWMTFRITDGEDIIDVKVRMDVENTPDDPVMTLDSRGNSVYQGGTWTMETSVTDVDVGDVHTFSVNLEEEILDDFPSIADQIPGADLGVDLVYDLNPDTGSLSLTPVGDDIWRTSSSLFEQVIVTVVVRVTDSFGRTDVKVTNVTLIKDGPWIPEVPDFTIDIRDEDPDTIGDQGMTVLVNAGDIEDIYGTGWVYSWSLGDGNRITGNELEHTYQPSGDDESYTYNIKLKLEKGEYSTAERSKTVTLTPVTEEEDKEDNDGESNLIYMILGGVFILAIVIILIIFLMMRGRSSPMVDHDRETPSYSEPAPTREVHTPTHQYERPRPVRENASGMDTRCPGCGAPVQHDWFLCPECKNTLKW